jgi:micrococcal nuclease
MPRSSTTLVPFLFWLIPAGCSAQQPGPPVAQACTISRVSDGDSFRCSDGRRVRLIGIDSPESQQQPIGAEARAALVRLLPSGSTVRLETDVAPYDQCGRTLAYAWTGTTLINETMVQDGWAVLYTVPPNLKYVDRLRRAQEEARARRTGLWSQHGFDCLPSDFRRGRCVSSP